MRSSPGGSGLGCPFLTVFAGLSLIVAVLVIGNVVSGAVIAGFRSIGVLKAVGFSPGQVTAAYLLMMTGPALVGCVIGAVLGNLAASWMLSQFSSEYVLGLDTSPAPWLTGLVAVAIPLLVTLTALVPALRAGSQSATAALAAGGVAAQQWVIRRIGDSEDSGLPQTTVDVYAAPSLVALFLAGMVIAVLGALIPARRAARVSTAAALHTE